MTKGDETLGCPQVHFKDVNRSLSFLRRDERFCDMAFLCHPSESSKSKKPKKVLAHQAVFAPHSKLIASLIEIAHQKQLSDCVYISLENWDELIVEKLVEYIYLGQTTIKKYQEESLNALVKVLDLSIKLDISPISESSSESEPEVKKVEQKKSPPKKRGRKSSTHGKKTARSPRKSHQDSSDDDEVKESDGEEMEQLEKLKADAVRKKSSVDLEHVEKSKDKEAKKYYKMALNPLFEKTSSATKSSSKNAPQKRRMQDDKKAADKAPKKARQEDGDSSDPDSEAVSARKREFKSVEESPKPVSKILSDSDSESCKKESVSPARPVLTESETEMPTRRLVRNPLVASRDSEPDPPTEKPSKKLTTPKLTPAARVSSPAPPNPTTTRADSESEGAKRKPTSIPSDTEPESAKRKPAAKSTRADSDDEGGSSKPGPKRKMTTGPSSSKVSNGSRRNSTVAKDEKKADKKPEKKLSASFDNIFATESVRYCGFCGKIFVGLEAHNRHVEEEHGGGDGDASKKNDNASDSETETPAKVERGRKPGPARRAGPASKKPATEDDKDAEESAKKSTNASPQKSMGPGSKIRPGPASSKSVEKPANDKEDAAKANEDSSKKKMGPKSKARPGPSSSKSVDKKSRRASNSGSRNGRKKSQSIFSSDDESKNEAKGMKHEFLDVSDSDGDEKSTSKNSKSPPTAKKPKIKISLTSASDKKKPIRPSLGGGDSGKGRKCKFCSEIFDKTSNLRNHVINHFKDKLMDRLPKCLPFICPECNSTSRDKITLLRHYGFSHKKVYEFCSEEDLAGERVDESPTRKSKASSGPASKKASNKNKASGSSDEDDKPKKVSSSDAEASKSKQDSDDEKEKKEDLKIAPVHFSDSDSDNELVSKKANDAIKSFDELFGDIGSNDEKVQNGEDTKSNKNGSDEDD